MTLIFILSVVSSHYSQPSFGGAPVTAFVSGTPYTVVSSSYASPTEQPPAYSHHPGRRCLLSLSIICFFISFASISHRKIGWTMSLGSALSWLDMNGAFI